MKRILILAVLGLGSLNLCAQSYQPQEDQRLSTTNNVEFNNVSAKGASGWLRMRSGITSGYNGFDSFNAAQNGYNSLIFYTAGATFYNPNTQTYADLVVGNITGNLTGIATNSSNWSGLGADWSGYGSSLFQGIGYDSAEGKAKPFQASQWRTWLGMPSTGETLQSIADRGYTTMKNAENAIIVQETTSGNNIQLYQQAGTSYLIAGKESGTPDQRLAIYTGGSEKLSISPNGNLGIGTPFPSSKLTISGALSQETSRMSIVNSEGGQAMIEAGITGVSNNGLTFKLANADGSNSNTRMVINANGNMGVGTTNPSEKLAVNGNISISDPTSGNYLGFGIAGINEYNAIGSMYSSAGLVLAHGLKPHPTSQELIYAHGNMARSAIVLGRGFSSGGIKFYTKSVSSETIGATFDIDPAMQLTDDGNLGIGTTTPAEKLFVNGNIGIKGNAANRYIITDETNTGTTKLTVQAGAGSSGFGGGINLYGHANVAKPGWVVAGISASAGTTGTSTEGRFTVNDQGLGNGTDLFTVLRSGNVGIGTTTPNEKLAVNGKIRAREVKVESANWPDYVFEEGYKVGTLQELESYIKTNKHLPEMPSAKEVEANGVELGEMNKLLLKKVEELTLHLIEKDKELLKEKERISKLEEAVKLISQQLNKKKD